MIFFIIFIICILITLVSIFFYNSILTYLVSNKKPLSKIERIKPITIIIPTLNEEKYIKGKIKNLLNLEYPKEKIDIFVVDNGSTDKTINLVKKLPVKLLISKRGKIAAINKGLEEAKTDIIFITDADAEISKNSIRNMVSYLSNNVGAICASTVLIRKNLFYMKSKYEYAKNDWVIRYKEGILDSVCSLDGKLLAFKKSLFDKFDKKTYVDDLELTIKLRKKGYKCIVDKDSFVYERTPLNIYEELRQIRNRASRSIIPYFRNINILFNPKYSYYGLFIFPFRRFFTVLFPFFAIYTLIYLMMFNWLLTILLITASLILILVTKKEYLLIQIIGVSLAWLDLLSLNIKSGGKWKKVKS